MSTFLEIGPGRGDFLFFLAQENPETTIIGVEYKRKRFDKLVKRVEKRGLQNVRLHLGDARLVLPEVFADESCDHIYILFSDPWPKRRHAPNRLFQPSFVKEVLRVLKSEGRIFIAHDDPEYVEQIKKVFRDHVSYFVYSDDGVQFTTFYAEKWVKEGRLISSFSYKKIGCPSNTDDLKLPCVLTAI